MRVVLYTNVLVSAALKQQSTPGMAVLLVSGDADLLALNPFRQIPIVRPAEFVQGLAR